MPLYRLVMTTSRPAEPTTALVDPATAKRLRDAILGERVPVTPEVLTERAERVRAATSGLRLGVALTPSLYR